MFKRIENYIPEKKIGTIARRKSDNTLWMPSCKDRAHAILALVGKAPCYYFKRLHKFKKGYIVNHNRVWEFNKPKRFEIINHE